MPALPAEGHIDDDPYRLLVDSIADYAVYMLDRQGCVVSWNRGAERFKGYTRDEIVGEHFSRFYTDEDRAIGLPATALRKAATEGRFENEGWRVRKDGTRFWAHVVIDPIRDKTGELVGFAKITRDLTERREAQQALEQAREALFQSQKLDAVGQLTGGVAHDFNNLLMAIVGSLELLRKRLPINDGRAAALLENAMQGAQRGGNLTQRLLQFARRKELKTEAVDLPSLVEGMLELMRSSVGPRVPIDTELPPGLPQVETDAAQLETAILNLVVNARDAMPGGGAVAIRARAEGAMVRLSVSDTGEGMDAETLARATEPFFTTKGIGKGTGLGLSMVHGLALQSGGRMEIESAPGEGTEVALLLPIAVAGARRQVVRPQAIAPASANAITVLAVDDDALVLMNIVAMLEDFGHRALGAASADEALKLLREHRVDLVITDYAMPGATGLQLAETIRRQHPQLPVMLATGYAELPSGVDPAFPRLTKPYLQHDLALAVDRAMADRPGASAAS